ncbi:MAG: parvulin peptidyl-prolyl isomerase [Pirellulaceae bacterium]|nr:parvulin peptidyl-prolyl isomerase [Pirellulaceae bacterium]
MRAASHILIMHRDSDRAPASIIRTRQEALTLVQEVAAKAKAEGADFAALAGEYSDCPSSAKGGDLGRFAPDQMVAAFSEATERLAVGEISDPVETQFGFHIIRRDP